MKRLLGWGEQRRGTVLITTLAIMTFLVMIATMLITTSYNSLRRASAYYQSSQAQQAQSPAPCSPSRASSPTSPGCPIVSQAR